MFGSTALLTLATLLGLAAGFCREWLLVADWGSGARTDAFLVAMFLPEAIRMMMAGGLLNTAALPMYQAMPEAERPAWLAGQVLHMMMLGLALCLIIFFSAPWLMQFVGVGLETNARMRAIPALRCLAWSMPGICLQALLSVPHQAKSQFVRAGLGSFLYNIPAVLVLFFYKQGTKESELAAAFVFGSVLMVLVLLHSLGGIGFSQMHWRAALRQSLIFYQRFLPLLASAAATQGIGMLERMTASMLGEGAITIMNLARKLINLPLVALYSLNQVLLSIMSRQTDDTKQRFATLRRGLAYSSLMTIPASVGLVGAAPTIVHLLLPAGLANGPLPHLLAMFAGFIVIGNWNALLARLFYSSGNTRTPFLCESCGNIIYAIALFMLPAHLGLPGIVLAALAGQLITGLVLLRGRTLRDQVDMRGLFILCCVALLSSGEWIYVLPAPTTLQIGVATLAALASVIAAAALLRSWYREPAIT